MRKPIRLSKFIFGITDVTDEKFETLSNLESENCHSIVINIGEIALRSYLSRECV